MFAKSRFLETMGPGGSTNQQQRHEWVSLAAPAEFVTATNTTNNDVDGSASATGLEFSVADAAKLKPGSLLINQTIATPVGTYQRNEILQIVTISTTTGIAVVARDAGDYYGDGGSAHTHGSTAHTSTSVYRIIHDPTQEGSVASADPNTYSADSIFENYTQINTMKMQLTGSQKARAMEVVSSEVERQWNRELIALKNKRVNMFLYGTNSQTAVGSDTVIRQSKGLLDFMVDNVNSSNILIDYTSTALTYDAINALFIKLFNNGADPSEPYKIVTSPVSKDVISTWDVDKVRTTIDNEQVGREITVFKSSMGFQAEIIAEPMCMKSDLFIIQPQKVFPMTFRPYESQEWGKGTQAPNGDDMWYRRTIGEETLMVIDPGYAHAALTYLTWI
jgi:hypothetical protein